VCLPYQVEDVHPGRPPLRSSTDLSRRTGCPINYLLIHVKAEKTRKQKIPSYCRGVD
jgi:hypothetical protein